MLKYPVKYIGITRGFSKNTKHYGVDFGWSSKYYGKNQNIYSVGKGIVISIQLQKSGGKVIHILHKEIGMVSEYGHLDTIKVKINQNVSSGTIIGTMGCTGNATGPHLHFGLYLGTKIDYNKKSNFKNPLDYLYASDEIIGEKTVKNYPIKYINDEEEKCTTYTVKSGDNLTKIAKKFNTTWEQIYLDNKSVIGNNPNLIRVGMKLVIK